MRHVFAASGQAAMTFEEIADALHITLRSAVTTYARAMQKLRKRPVVLAHLAALAAEVEKSRPLDPWLTAGAESEEDDVA